ncbi:MAG: CRISPR-associated helicase Cas3' [Ruminococcus sp.]
MDIHNALAKTDETIEEHTNKLLKAAKLLYDLGYIKTENLYKDLIVACKNHDMGKLNSQFQIRIKRNSKFCYEIEVPHAVLSVFFVDEEDCNNATAVLFAILYHHYRKESPMVIFKNERELISKFLTELGFVENEYKKMRRSLNKVKNIFETPLESPEKQYAVLLKGLLHKCDYSASAGIECEKKNDFLLECIDNWSKNNFEDDFEYNKLQIFCMDNRDNNLIVTAPTGMGKTEAGLLWCGNNKCFFVLPLKTAINAMYDRIKKLSGADFKDRVALVHSDMKSYYLKDSKGDSDESFDFDYLEYSKQFSLPITVCTPDQIFDFALKYPGYEYKLAISSYSKFIIDEIQMYSPDVLAAIIYAIKMIHTVGGKVAVLTATLPPFVRKELLGIFGDDVVTNDFSEEGKLRHNVKVFEDKLCSQDVYDIVSNTKGEQVKKYLVICNTIPTANRIYRELIEGDIDADIHLFHASFIQKDRMDKEKKIMSASKEKPEDMKRPEIWVSTSVVEASLDINFDVLITEMSDLFSLFQRFGRVNRNGKKDFSKYNCYVFTELQDKATEFVDKTIHSLSKQAILTVDGIVTEEDKNNLIETYLSAENIENSQYYKEYCTIMENYQKGYDYLKSKDDGIRSIDRISVIPKPVYDDNYQEICNALDVLKSDTATSEDKLKERDKINLLTVSVSMYRCKRHQAMKYIDRKYISIPVVNCKYSKKTGIEFEDDSSDDSKTRKTEDNFEGIICQTIM